MRIAAIRKPHLFPLPHGGWACCQMMTNLGRGMTPQTAYANWLWANT